MRGGSVGILVVLECDGTEYTVLTRQARVPMGTANLPEIPAGMLDGSGNFKGVTPPGSPCAALSLLLYARQYIAPCARSQRMH